MIRNPSAITPPTRHSPGRDGIAHGPPQRADLGPKRHNFLNPRVRARPGESNFTPVLPNSESRSTFSRRVGHLLSP
jgi:hypothetical protein